MRFGTRQGKTPLPGKFLEGLLQKTQGANMRLYRLQDPSTYGGKTFRSKNPCDCIGHVDGIPFMIEAKETAGSSIPLSKLTRDQSVHQYNSMMDWTRDPRCRAGYLVHLGASRTVLYVPVGEVSGFSSVTCGRGYRGCCLETESVDWLHLFLGRPKR